MPAGCCPFPRAERAKPAETPSAHSRKLQTQMREAYAERHSTQRMNNKYVLGEDVSMAQGRGLEAGTINFITWQEELFLQRNLTAGVLGIKHSSRRFAVEEHARIRLKRDTRRVVTARTSFASWSPAIIRCRSSTKRSFVPSWNQLPGGSLAIPL